MLPDALYRKLLGLPSDMPSVGVSELLKSMMSKSIGTSMVEVVVEVLGTVETQDLLLQVSTKAREEATT